MPSHSSRRGFLSALAATATVVPLTLDARATTPVDAVLSSPRLPLPTRPSGAPTGSAWAARYTGTSDATRYAAAVDSLLQGNLPAHLRRLSPVVLRSAGPGTPELVIHVTSDYLAVGSDRDFLRVPLDHYGAVAMARATGMLLPTPRIVDAVYAAAPTKLTPHPLPPTSKMRTLAWIQDHHAAIEAEREGPLVPLIAGHKKDVVMTTRLLEQPGRVAIYGWHRPSGRPIQPLSLVHGASYGDYSHGIRLVHPVALLGGKEVALTELLADPELRPLLTREAGMAAVVERLELG